MAQPVEERVVVDDRVRERDEERRERHDAGEQQPAQRRAAVARRVDAERREQREQHDPARVLRRRGEADADPRDEVVQPAARPQDPRRAPQREAQRRERGDVVERQVAVEDRQERHGEQCGREQPCRASREPPAGEVEQADGHRAQHRARRAGHRPHRGRVARERLPHRQAPAVADGQQDVQDVRVGRGIDVVARVQVVAEHPDRARQEVRVLVGVVGVRAGPASGPRAAARAPAGGRRRRRAATARRCPRGDARERGRSWLRRPGAS